MIDSSQFKNNYARSLANGIRAIKSNLQIVNTTIDNSDNLFKILYPSTGFISISYGSYFELQSSMIKGLIALNQGFLNALGLSYVKIIDSTIVSCKGEVACI